MCLISLLSVINILLRDNIEEDKDTLTIKLNNWTLRHLGNAKGFHLHV